MNLNGIKRNIANDAKTRAVLSRIADICKEKRLRFVANAKLAHAPGSMFTDGKRIFSASVDSFPSAEAVALAFCHELAHNVIWEEEKAGTPRCFDKFDEELTAWSLGVGLWHKLFRGLRMRTFSQNFPLRRYVMSQLATYAGMFNISYEGFYWNGKPQVFTMDTTGNKSRKEK